MRKNQLFLICLLIFNQLLCSNAYSQNEKLNASLKIENKDHYTKQQLSDLEKSLVAYYAKWKGQDINKEPLKSAADKELDQIVLKNLGVSDVTTKNFGIFLYPEINAILNRVKQGQPTTQSKPQKPQGSQEKYNAQVTPNSVSNAKGLSILSVNFNLIKLSQFELFKKEGIKFKISEPTSAKNICRTILMYNTKNVVEFQMHDKCKPIEIKNSEYIEGDYSNDAEMIKKALSEGKIIKIVYETYLTDAKQLPSNKVTISFEK
jgi:hypothetical protein